MALNIEEIKAQLALGGARPTLFEVQITNPVNGVADIKVPFSVKATQIPPETIGVIEVPYMGRKIKIAGDRTYAEWTVTVQNDEDFIVRNALEEWASAINKPEGNVATGDAASPLLYKGEAKVVQLAKDGTPIREYEVHGIWPSEIGAIELDWDGNDTIEEFTVTFQYDWHSVSGITGNAGGST